MFVNGGLSGSITLKGNEAQTMGSQMTFKSYSCRIYTLYSVTVHQGVCTFEAQSFLCLSRDQLVIFLAEEKEFDHTSLKSFWNLLVAEKDEEIGCQIQSTGRRKTLTLGDFASCFSAARPRPRFCRSFTSTNCTSCLLTFLTLFYSVFLVLLLLFKSKKIGMCVRIHTCVYANT